MKALVVNDFKKGPQWSTFTDPTPERGEVLVTVSAVALTNLLKGQTNGTHYTKTPPFPFVPGAEGVGRLPNGKRVYFFGPRKPFGTLAEATVVRENACVPIPDDLTDVEAAGLANPAMSSWAALTRRAKIEKGETVLINGATGTSGKLAIQIAKHLGAARIIATGRDTKQFAKLRELGATETIALDESFKVNSARVFGETTIVLDYLWGASAETLLQVIGEAHTDRAIRYVQIGSIAGANIQLPAFPLRSTALSIMGSGLGSVSDRELLGVIGDALAVAKRIGLQVDVAPTPIESAEHVWNEPGSDRIVFTIGKRE